MSTGFSIATFNALDLLDTEPPNVIGRLDAKAWTEVEQTNAKRLYAARAAAVARMLQRMDADVVAFQEVKNARVLDAAAALIPARNGKPNGGYLPAVAARSDARGIGVGLLSRFPIASVKEHAPTDLPFPVINAGDPPPFAGRLGVRRAMLDVEIALPDGTTVRLIVVHFKSKLPVGERQADGTLAPMLTPYAVAEGDARSAVARVAEGLFVRKLVDEALTANPDLQLVVLGDFNDQPDSLVVRAVMGRHYDALRAELGVARGDAAANVTMLRKALYPAASAVPQAGRFTSMFRGVPEQIDHILVSHALWPRLRGARVFNEMLSEWSSIMDGSGHGTLESDHAPLRAEFE